MCGAQLYGNGELCAHHHGVVDDWAEANRIMCNFFHRGILLNRLRDENRVGPMFTDGGEAY